MEHDPLVEDKADVKEQALPHPKADIRLSLVVSTELNAMLERWAATAHSTKSQILRKALALYDLAATKQQEGNSLAIVDKNGHVISEIVGI
jgi:hypothetical protein